MRWMPKNNSIHDVLTKLGFYSANRGYILKRKHMATKPVQMHALTYPDGVELHSDYVVDGRHISDKNYSRDSRFFEIFTQVDNGEIPVLSKKMAKNYPDMVRAIKLIPLRLV